MIVTALLVLSLLFSFALAMLCAGCETGFMSVSRGRVLHLARSGGKRGAIVQTAVAEIDRTVTVLLVGNNFAAVTLSSASAALSTRLCGGSALAETVWSVVMAFLVLFACEFMPKLAFSARPLARTLQFAHVWRAVSRVLSAPAALIQFVIVRFLPKKTPRSALTPESVLRILEDRKDGVKLTDFESALIGRIMVLRANNREVTPEALLSVLVSDPD